MIERFDGKQVAPPEGAVKIMDSLETPRCWLIEGGGNQLIQVQADRFIHNWRTLRESDSYPHYASIRGSFVEELACFDAFVAREGLGTLKPNQCEISYVNQIRPSGVWQGFGQADRIFRSWKSPESSSVLPPPEDVRFNVRYQIAGKDGRPAGRLHVNIQPGYHRPTGEEVFVMNLTARGTPDGEGLEGALRFLDQGHDLIVRAFTELTHSQMHQVWRKRV